MLLLLIRCNICSDTVSVGSLVCALAYDPCVFKVVSRFSSSVIEAVPANPMKRQNLPLLILLYFWVISLNIHFYLEFRTHIYNKHLFYKMSYRLRLSQNCADPWSVVSDSPSASFVSVTHSNFPRLHSTCLWSSPVIALIIAAVTSKRILVSVDYWASSPLFFTVLSHRGLNWVYVCCKC